MIITSYSNIDLIQGVIGYGNATEGITDWRIENTGAGIFNINNSSSIIRPSGGTTEIGQITNSTDRYIIFKEGTSTFTVPTGGIVCDILVVGGGGGGGNDRGGGGGAGGLVFQTGVTLNGTINVSVGIGGIASVNDTTTGGNGGVSSIGSIIAIGGGGGGSEQSNANNGGSGGGSAYNFAISHFGTGDQPASASGGYGNRGGDARDLSQSTTNRGCGGGGGAGTRGLEATSLVGGAGGDGLAGVGSIDFKTHFNLPTNNTIGQYIAGENKVYFAGGGGGGDCVDGQASPSPHGLGGKGGGANGNTSANIRGTVLANSGGGGGGGRADGQLPIGSNGGSGIVIIRYRTTNISIIDNGNVGISTTPISSSSKLEIYGDINISGNYKLNNRDVINDTSNYILTTSNLLVPRIITEVGHGSNYVSRINTQLNTRIDDTSNYVARTSTFLANNVSSQWTNVSSGIHYTPTPSLLSITSSPSATTIGTTGDYTYMTFTYTTETAGAGTGQSLYTINVPTGGAICDILIVGGGGSGSESHGGGGGAGAVIFMTNVNMNGNYTIKVGKGGVCQVTNGLNGVGNKGKDTEIFKTNNISNKVVAEGGGGGGQLANANGGSGGSGGGGDAYNVAAGIGGAATPYTPVLDGVTGIKYGNNGGNAFGNPGHGGGGGGAGGAGENALAGYNSGNTEAERAHGGVGIKSATINYVNYDFKTLFGTNTGGGVLEADGFLYFGGGGGNGRWNYLNNNEGGNGGLGGGGKGGWGTSGGVTAPLNGRGYPGINGTGGGGGGGGDNTPAGGDGGSGIVILRFLSSTRNVGIGTTNPTSELHVYDDTTTNTKLTVQNNFIEPIVISPNTIGYTVAETLESNKFYRTITFNYFPNYPEDSPNTALLAWYRFDGDGLDYNPYVTKHNLINTGATYSSGTAADSFFQGRRYINLNTGGMYGTTLALANRAFSFALWLRITSTAGAFFVVQGPHGTNTSLHIGTRGNNGYSLAFYSNDLECGVGVPGNPTSYPGDLNNWVHLVYVVLPNYNRRIYRNGVLISQDANTAAFYGSGNFNMGGTIHISDFRIYNNGLSATEVANLYASYTNLVITDNYSVNFKSPTTLLVNGTSKTVNGAYLLSMGHLNDSMLPASGQTDIPLASTVLTSLPIKYEYSNTALSLPALITVAGATSSFIGTTERAISFTYTSDSTGYTGQTLYTFTPTEDLWCDILIVGGGGGGGCFGGGGGGGGVLFGANLKLSAGIGVTVKVGDGGTGATTVNSGINGVNGYNSSIIINSIEYIALGGGGGGTRFNAPHNGSNGSNGGSGGGGSTGDNVQGLGGISNKNNYSNFQSFGNNGGNGNTTSTQPPMWLSGGGGGAGSIGSDFSRITGGGNGGRGKDFISYFGTNVGHFGFFAGGGGGGSYVNAGNRGYGNGGLGLYGGGGNAGFDGTLEYSADNGLINTGGGGGGSKLDGTTSGNVAGGKGGSGFVIIRYRKFTTQSASLELITPLSISEPGIITKQFPETPSINSNSWADNGFNVVSKTNSSLHQSFDVFNLFENTLNTYYHSANLFNGSSPFNFSGSTTFKGVNSLTISIDLGRSIIIRSMRIAPWRDTATTALPGIFKIFASNDSASWNDNNHSSWIEIHSQTTSLTFAANTYTNFGNFSTINIPYRYFVMAVYNLTGNYGYLVMSEWDIFGTDNITPVVINSDYKYLSFRHNPTAVEQKTGVSGWRLVRFLPPTANAWHPINDNLAGTTVYGTAYNNTNAWSIPFGTYDEFCFSTLGLRYWLYTTKNQAIGQAYDGASRTIIRSSISTTPYTAVWYNRTGALEDPWIGLRNHAQAPGSNPDAGGDLILYGENSFSGGHWSLPAISVDGGVCVWVRNRADTNIQTSYSVNFPENTMCDLLVVGGGGGGGYSYVGGGGGSGGYVYLENISIPAGNYTINVGCGGSDGIDGASPAGWGGNGGNSSITGAINYIALGGGGGAGGSAYGTITGIGNNGGSGGGGSYRLIGSVAAAGGTSTQLSTYGYGTGGSGNGYGSPWQYGGGGGGASGVIRTVNNAAGNDGLSNSITGSSITYAGGGAGGHDYEYVFQGGSGGGGAGANGSGTIVAAVAGTDGLGGGGGGARGSGIGIAARGGSGIVIIRYRSAKIGNRGYNIGNYNGDFKIVSSTYLSNSQDTDFMRITRDGASIYNPTGTPLWSTVSDRRIKENIEKASYDKCFESINKLELYRFSYIKELNNINKDLKQLGYIAQEVKDIFPKAVSTQEFYNENLSISDMLSIDVTQINYSLYGAVKKLMEMYNDIEKQISLFENILNIDNTIVNVPIDTITSNIAIDTLTSNITLDITTSNLIIDTSITSNITLDTTTSNISLDTTTSNLTIDTSITSNITHDITTSNLTIDTPITSNISLDTTTSNLTIDTPITSNISLDTTTSNIILDTSTSNLTLDTTTSNLTLDTTTSNLSN
jgi:hypothetical protein